MTWHREMLAGRRPAGGGVPFAANVPAFALQAARLQRLAQRVGDSALNMLLCLVCAGWMGGVSAMADTGFPAPASTVPALPRLSLEVTPTPFRFRYDTTQTRTRSISADRSGEDLHLTRDAGSPHLLLALDTGTPWRFSLEHFQTSATDQATLNRKQYLFNLFPLTVNADVRAQVSVDHLKLTASRTILDTPTSTLGLDLGLGVTRAAWSLTSTNPQVQEGVVDKGVLPLPSLGLHAAYRPSSRIRLALKGDYFALSRQDTQGRSYSFKGELAYHPKANLTFVAGLARSTLRVSLQKPDYTRDIELSHGGPYLGVRHLF